jgi:hypothetical protein
MPYESVYAIGEIKSAYYKHKEYIQTFSKTLKRMKEELVREHVPPNYLGNGITLSQSFSTGEVAR